MKNSIIAEFENKFFSREKVHPSFRPGDSIRVNYKIEEIGAKGEKKFRIQAFEGVCTRYKKGTADSAFGVRKIGANGVGVERIFPLLSPSIDSIDIIAGGRVRRSRLYYLRELSGKAARIRTRRLPQGTVMSTVLASSKVDAK